jgi:hypothetical protein
MGQETKLTEIHTSMYLEFVDIFSSDCSSMFGLLNLHTTTDRKLFYLVTFFTISEKWIILHIPALYASPVIGSGNLRISIQLCVRIPRAVSKLANFIITEHHHACCTHYVLRQSRYSDENNETLYSQNIFIPHSAPYIEENLITIMTAEHKVQS